MTDPVQMLIDAGAIPVSPFGPSSRYANVAIARYSFPAGDDGQANTVAYVQRRFIPQARDIPVATWHIVRAGERIDHLAAHYLGDVELTWRVADANLITDMLEIGTEPGARVAIPLPAGA
jgi:hypothetical protein